MHDKMDDELHHSNQTQPPPESQPERRFFLFINLFLMQQRVCCGAAALILIIHKLVNMPLRYDAEPSGLGANIITMQRQCGRQEKKNSQRK